VGEGSIGLSPPRESFQGETWFNDVVSPEAVIPNLVPFGAALTVI